MAFFIRMWGILAELLLRRVAFARARFFVDKMEEWLGGVYLLDIGCGAGHIAVTLARLGLNVTMIDVKPPWKWLAMRLLGLPCALTLSALHQVPHRHFDGKRVPYDNRKFDTVLLAFVLHHAQNSDQLLSEAIRVTKRRLIVFEDIPPVRKGKARWWRASDFLLNLEVAGGGAHANKSYGEWVRTFEAMGLEVAYSEQFESTVLGGLLRFPNVMFILEPIA